MSFEADDAGLALSLDIQWSRWVRRYSWHLDQVPGLFDAMRSDVVPLGATSYDRVKVDQSRDGVPVPFRVDVVDSIDDLWSALVQYAENVAELLEAALPGVNVWRVQGEVSGVRPGADVRHDAHLLVGWLVERVEAILPLAELNDSEEHLFTLIRQNAKRFLTPQPEKRRLCGLCGIGHLVVRWTRTGETSECDRCGDFKQLDVPAPHSRLCAAAAHDTCD